MENAFEQAMSTAGPQLLSVEAHEHQRDPYKYMNHLKAEYQHHPLMENIVQASVILGAQENTVFQSDSDFPGAQAFMAGALLGVRVAEEFFSDITRESISATELAQLPFLVLGSPQEKSEIKLDLMLSADDGYNDAQKYHSLFEEWQKILVPDADYYEHMGVGFGYVVQVMREAWDAQVADDVISLEKQADVGIEWDGVVKAIIDETGTDVPEMIAVDIDIQIMEELAKTLLESVPPSTYREYSFNLGTSGLNANVQMCQGIDRNGLPAKRTAFYINASGEDDLKFCFQFDQDNDLCHGQWPEDGDFGGLIMALDEVLTSKILLESESDILRYMQEMMLVFQVNDFTGQEQVVRTLYPHKYRRIDKEIERAVDFRTDKKVDVRLYEVELETGQELTITSNTFYGGKSQMNTSSHPALEIIYDADSSDPLIYPLIYTKTQQEYAAEISPYADGIAEITSLLMDLSIRQISSRVEP